MTGKRHIEVLSSLSNLTDQAGQQQQTSQARECSKAMRTCLVEIAREIGRVTPTVTEGAIDSKEGRDCSRPAGALFTPPSKRLVRRRSYPPQHHFLPFLVIHPCRQLLLMLIPHTKCLDFLLSRSVSWSRVTGCEESLSELYTNVRQTGAFVCVCVPFD